MSRTKRDHLFIMLKGFAMGASEVVPGVSGATIAFISGIYNEIIESVNQLNFKSIKILFTKGPGEFWRHINGNFMLSISFGILLSIYTLAKLFSYLSHQHPIFIWSFFFGVIISSTVYVLKDYKYWNFQNIFIMLLGIGITVLISTFTPLTMVRESEYWIIAACGIIVACALYFPGISATIILILLGQYEFILKAITTFRMDYVLIYFGSAFITFFVFAKLFASIVKKFQGFSTALLTGLMIGSLYKLWPWKHTLLSHTNQFAQLIPVKQENVLPISYFDLTGKDPQTLYAILMAIAGFLIIYLLHNTFSKPKLEPEI